MSDPSDTPPDQPPDLDDLSRRYLDLWQEQLSGMARDPEIAALMARTLALMNAGAAQFQAAASDLMGGQNQGKGGNDGQTATRPDKDDRQQSGAGEPAGKQNRAAPPGPASGDADALVADLNRRLAELEDRLAVVESNAGPKNSTTGKAKSGKARSGVGRPAKGSRKRRS